MSEEGISNNQEVSKFGFEIGGRHFSADDEVKIKRTNGEVEKDWKIAGVISDRVSVYKKSENTVLRKDVLVEEFLKWQDSGE